MLPITDLNNDTHLVTNIKNLVRNKRVNGEKTIQLFSIPDEYNLDGFESVGNESTTIFDGEPYIIKKINEKSVGETSVKQADAVHAFFNTMINCQQYNLHTGSQTFIAALTRVFENTPFTFVIVDSFLAQTFENFGRDNCLSLFKNVLERYGAEFRVVGNIVYLHAKIGAKTDFQLRWKSNIKGVNKQEDTESLATVIKGFGGKPDENGVYPIQETYVSPNFDLFGELHADAVYDERFSTVSGMQAHLKKVLVDEPQLSITVDIAEVDGDVKNEGDTGYIIYEPMGIKLEARIVEVIDTFEHVNGEWVVVKTDVTLANLRNKLSDITTRFAKTSKRVDGLFGGGEKLPFSAMDEAVKNATNALLSAQTELEFNNGIIARDKTNGNKLVLFNSGGIGVSNDGGVNFPNAITGDGIVAEAIIAGMLQGMTFLSDDGTSTMWVQGGDIRLTDTGNGRNLNLNPLGMTGFDSGGNILFQATKTWVTSSILGTNTTNVYTAAQSNGEHRVVDINGIPGDGLVASYNYLPIRASGIFGNFWNINPASGNNAQNLYARPLSDGEVRVTANSTTDLYRDLRARTTYTNAIENNTLFGESLHMYVRPRSTGEVRATAAGTTDNYVPVRASGYFGAFIDTPETHLYLRPAGDPGEARVTVRGTTDVYQPIRAKDFITDTSVRDNKTNIETFDLDTLSTVRTSSAYLYNRTTDKEGARKQLGLMIDELPEVTHSDYGDSFALYALSGFNFKVAKDILNEHDKLKAEFDAYKQSSTDRFDALLARVEALEAQ